MRLSKLVSILPLLSYCVINGFAQYSIRTYAGNGLAANSAKPATTVAISEPVGVAPDGAGGIYIAAQGIVYRLTGSGFIIRAAGNGSYGYGGDGGLATDAQLSEEIGVATDSMGNLYIADSGNRRIRKVTADGVITTVAGNGTRGYGGDGGPATSALLDYPVAVATDLAGSIYIVEYFNNRIRKVTADGIISTVAGNGGLGFSGDGGPATAAKMYNPTGVAVDADGNIYIADKGNTRIRRVTTGGVIDTVAGGGSGNSSGDGGPATNARLSYTLSVAVDSAGNFYFSEEDHSVRKVSGNGIISTVAGNGNAGFSGDGGPATAANLYRAWGLATDTLGGFYIADFGNHRVRKVTAAGLISTVAGNGTYGYSGDGGPATESQLHYPSRMAIDYAGNFYIADQDNHRIRKISIDGIISTVAGNGAAGFSGDGGPATAAQLNSPLGVAVDSAGNIYIADWYNYRIRKVSADGVISTVAGNGAGAGGSSGDGGRATDARIYPYGVAADSQGNVYIPDSYRIRKVTANGVIGTVAGGGSGGDGSPATDAKLNGPFAVTIDFAGNLYIAEYSGNCIRKVGINGLISTVAGNGVQGFGGDGGLAVNAQLYWPADIAADSAGNLYIADSKNHRIRKVTPDGMISTVAGNGVQGFGGDGGLAIEAQLDTPRGVLADPAGYIYIGDYYNNRIRKLTAFTSPSVNTADVTSITQTAASGGGNVTSDGGIPVSARGVCWNTSGNPTITDICTNNGAGTGAYTSSMSGLTAGTSYHVRAYATNAIGTSYGTDRVFITLGANFQVGADSGGSFVSTVSAGSVAIYNLAVTGINNFAGSVSFSCSGLPTATTCTINPSPLMVSGSAAVPFRVTIATTTGSKGGYSSTRHPRIPLAGFKLVTFICLGSLIIIASIRRQRRLSFAFLLLSAAGLAACGHRPTVPASRQSTPVGIYTVVLTATSGSISHTINLTLSVH
jgi:trimeric autotransporter adhesin